MTTARITAVMLDGTKHEATGVYMALADRVAYERQYESSIIALGRAARALRDDGDAADVPDLRLEQDVFFSWRLLERGGRPVGTFEEFLTGVEDIDVDVQEGPADPTAEALQPGTLPS